MHTPNRVIELIFASANANKVNEIRKMLPDGFKLKGLAELNLYIKLPEHCNTIPYNALQKVRFLKAESGFDSFSDDSGLFIQALDGKPGVHSAHYAGLPPDPERNIAMVLSQMKGISNRSAQFLTSLALILDGKEYLFNGHIHGRIATQKRGNGGFGYDPIFIPDGFEQTFAELEPEIKNRISHRAVAFKALVEFLKIYPL